MSGFDQIGNVVRGALSNAAGDVERNNAEAVFEAAIASRTVAIAQHTDALAGLAARRDLIARNIEKSEVERQSLLSTLQAATQQGEHDTASVLQTRLQEIERDVERQTADVLAVAQQVEDTKSALLELRELVAQLKAERETAIVQLETAEARIDIEDSMSGLSDKASERALDSVRESVGVLQRRAHPGYLDSEGNSIREKAAAMGRKSAKERAREELERLKREYAEAAQDTSDDQDQAR